MNNDQPHELHLKYRPQSTKDIIGQQDVIRSLNALGKANKFPHTVLLSGHRGTGKTSLARIYARRLKCGDRDIHEVNCAEARGIDMARDIKQRITMMPLAGDTMAYILDEAHQQTSECQSALLKILEEPPQHVYFFLCTTDPQKLKPTILSRCHPAKLTPLNAAQLNDLLTRVIDAEGMEVGEEVRDKIIENAGGSARDALVLLNMLVGIDDEEEQLSIIAKADAQTQSIELVKTLLQKGVKWPAVAKILRGVKDEEPERLRHLVLAYVTPIVLGGGGGSARAFVIMDEFCENFFDSKYGGLVRACYNVVESGD